MSGDAPNRAPSVRDVDPVEDLLARLRLDRSARADGVVIVEGPTDRTVLAAGVPIDPRRLFPVAGRTNVLRCATELGAQCLTGVVCVADRDFDESEDNWKDLPILVFFDEADVEAMVLRSAALDRFLAEWSVAEKIDGYGGVDAVRRRLTEVLEPVSVLRYENARRGLGLDFDAIVLTDVLDKDGTLKLTNLIGRLADSASDRTMLTEAAAGDAPQCPHTGRKLTRGRDAIDVLTMLLRKKIASMAKQQVSAKFVEKSLRLAVSPGDLDGTPFMDRFLAALTDSQTASA